MTRGSRTVGALLAMRGLHAPEVVLVALLAACGVSADSLGPDRPTSIEVAPSRATLAVGETTGLTAVTPVGNLIWTTSAGSIASVNGEGTVTGLAPGAASISVHDSYGNSASMALTVGDRDVVWQDVSVGREGHACGLATDGRAFCWGGALAGRLGNGVAGGPEGSSQPFLEPVPVSGGLAFRSLSAGGRHTCGVATDGRGFCWGSGADGALGNGSHDDAAVPVQVGGALTFTSVSAGGGHTCGVTAAGAVYCWGSGDSGQLGNGSFEGSSLPAAVASGVAYGSVSVGLDTTCGVATTGEAYCWGSGDSGQLGNGSTVGSAVPVPVAGGLGFATVSVGDAEVCGVTVVFERFCWGTPRGREEGEDDALQTTPGAAEGSFRAVALGAVAGCGIDPAGAAFCWWPQGRGEGDDQEGGQFATRIVDGRGDEVELPRRVEGGHQFTSISTGNFSACAVTTGGRAFCWGRADGGILGNGASTLLRAPMPIQVSDPAAGT